MFFLINRFLYIILFVITLAFDRAVLYGNFALSIVVLLTEKSTPDFQKRFSFSSKLVLNSLKICCDCYIKTYPSLKGRAILKMSSFFL